MSSHDDAVKVVKAIAKLERDLAQAIDERDKAEEALSQAYYLATGRSPEWSNKFGHDDAVEEIGDVVAVLKAEVVELRQRKNDG